MKPNMDGMADPKELEEYRSPQNGFLLGRVHEDHGVDFAAEIDDDRHIFINAGSRSGKGISMIIPNLIHWQGGLLCIDPKGENASITAMRRGKEKNAEGSGTEVKSGNFLGQEVAILDPFNSVEGPARKYRTTYDPMLDIEIGSDDEATQILAIAESIVMQEKSGSGSHFTESGETILAGLIEAVIHSEKDPTDHTLTTCRDISLKGYDGLKEYLVNAPDTDAGLADDAFSILNSVGEDEGGSFISTLSRQLKWMADPRMQRHLKDSGFSLVKALREGWSVYICVPPSRIPRTKRWLRCLVRVALEAKMNSPTEHKGQQTLFCLDEFFSLGEFSIIEDSAAYMAGYGIKLVPVIQNIGQIKKLYEKNWETFLGNAGAIIGWGLNDMETEKYISDRMGPVMGWERSYGESRSSQGGDPFPSGSSSQSENLSMRDRPVRWPNEIHSQGAREEMRAFIIPASGSPFTIERVSYEEWNGQGLFDSPAWIQKWEAELPQELREKLDKT